MAVAAEADEDALRLADSAPMDAERPKNWKVHVEASTGLSRDRALFPGDDVSLRRPSRASIDALVSQPVLQNMRATLSDRLDIDWNQAPTERGTTNTAREWYLTWQGTHGTTLDVGRVNNYNGVAIGYNPTDYFRAGALKSVASIDPQDLKINRLGSVMLRWQAFYGQNSVTALFSPRLTDASTSSSPWNTSAGETNDKNRVLVSMSHRFSANLNPQFLLFKDEWSPARAGLDLTALIGDATVVYLEWSGGRQESFLSRSQELLQGMEFRQSYSTGITYTTSSRISLTLELEGATAGQREADWQMLAYEPFLYEQYRKWTQINQELPTRHELFLFLKWQDMLFPKLDGSFMTRENMEDHSTQFWLELRYHLNKNDLAFQDEFNRGQIGSEYGTLPLRQSFQFVWRHYF